MERIFRGIILALVCCLAFGCMAQAAEESITLYGVSASPQDEALDLSGKQIASTSELTQKLPSFENLTEVKLGATQLSMADIKEIQEAFPAIVFAWESEQYGQRVTNETTEIDLGEVMIEGEKTARALRSSSPSWIACRT